MIGDSSDYLGGGMTTRLRKRALASLVYSDTLSNRKIGIHWHDAYCHFLYNIILAGIIMTKITCEIQ
jgi:hypothetical protein